MAGGEGRRVGAGLGKEDERGEKEGEGGSREERLKVGGKEQLK